MNRLGYLAYVPARLGNANNGANCGLGLLNSNNGAGNANANNGVSLNYSKEQKG